MSPPGPTARSNLTGDGEPERVAAAHVSANLFPALGAQPMIGRVFTDPKTFQTGRTSSCSGSGSGSGAMPPIPSIVDRTILINGQSFQVLGVMPPDFVLPTDFQNPEPTQLWTPLQMDPASTDHGSHGLYAAGRLQPGATVRQAADELSGIARAMTSEGLYPVQMQFDTVVLSLTDEVVGNVRRAVWLLFGAVGFLLLIACANVANLLLARAEARQREIAVRSALGAGGWRVVRQLLTESLVLSSVSAVAGLGLAYAGVRFLAWWNPANIPRVAGVTLDARVLLFTAAVAIADQRAVQPRAGAARAENDLDRLAQGRRPERVHWRRPPAIPQRARRRRDGARGGPAGWRGADAAKPVGACSACRLGSIRPACSR